ncbi:MAG: RDD family protein [bacterium]|nr:RDD family protein [Myxococcales bacterium]MCB9543793.1 RDD family protein [Myxococcales bacterium]MCB9551444.1 RDD family protein [Myxococcales bacterium]
MSAWHTITTPEGVPLAFRRANLGDRLSAFLVDLCLIGLITLAPIVVAWHLGGGDIALAIALLVAFVTRTFYFTLFEWRRRGRTPGKQRLGLRVIDARGGPLTAQAIIARNLTRELELFLPLVAAFAPELLVPDADGWITLLTTGWMLGFLLLPLLTRDRLRLGDLIAGTRVVAVPRVALLPELVRSSASAAYSFTPDQLRHYGNRELQVLEDVLRRGDVDPATLRLITDKICNRIGWPAESPVEPHRFLRDFYAAQRAGLERGLLFGRRHEDKDAARAAHRATPRRSP